MSNDYPIAVGRAITRMHWWVVPIAVCIEAGSLASYAGLDLCALRGTHRGFGPSVMSRDITFVELREQRRPQHASSTLDIINGVPDILIRDVPDDVVAALDANARSAGQTRAEYLRRLLADQQGPSLTREQMTRFTERTADLADPEVMAAAWR